MRDNRTPDAVNLPALLTGAELANSLGTRSNLPLKLKCCFDGVRDTGTEGGSLQNSIKLALQLLNIPAGRSPGEIAHSGDLHQLRADLAVPLWGMMAQYYRGAASTDPRSTAQQVIWCLNNQINCIERALSEPARLPATGNTERTSCDALESYLQVAYNDLGELQHQLHFHESAGNFYIKSLELDTSGESTLTDRVLRNLMKVASILGSMRSESAMPLYSYGIKRYYDGGKPDLGAHYSLSAAEALSRAEQYEQACAVLDEAICNSREYEIAHNAKHAALYCDLIWTRSVFDSHLNQDEQFSRFEQQELLVELRETAQLLPPVVGVSYLMNALYGLATDALENDEPDSGARYLNEAFELLGGSSGQPPKMPATDEILYQSSIGQLLLHGTWREAINAKILLYRALDSLERSADSMQPRDYAKQEVDLRIALANAHLLSRSSLDKGMRHLDKVEQLARENPQYFSDRLARRVIGSRADLLEASGDIRGAADLREMIPDYLPDEGRSG